MKSVQGIFMKLSIAIFVVGLSLSVQHALAFSGPGAGTGGDPFIIANCVQLQEMNDDLDASYRLANDIDCSDTTNWNGSQGFVPIGDFGTEFTGSFDGDEHVISDLFINRTGDNNALFGKTSGATIIDVQVTGSITGENYTGGLVGIAENTTVSKSSSLVTVAGDEFVGGLIGFLDGGSVTDSYVRGNVTGDFHVGGFAGTARDVVITRVYASGSVDGDGNTGGFIGHDIGGNTYTQLFWDTQTSGINVACGDAICTGITGKTTAQMKQYATYNPNSEDYGFALDDGYAGYRYIKWNISTVRMGWDTNCYTGDVCTQASEFQLLRDGFPISLLGATATNPGGIEPGGTGPDKLIDNNTGTKFLDAAFSAFNNSNGSTDVIIDAGNGNHFTFNGYNWATGGDQYERDPTAWSVSGSNDGSTYDVLDSRSGFNPTSSRGAFVASQNSQWNFNDTWGINPVNNSGYPFLQWEGYVNYYNAPTVTTVSPTDGTTGTAVDVPIVINFSKPMNTTSLIVSTGPCGDTCPVYDEEWSNNNKTVTLTKNNGLFTANTTYTVTVTSAEDIDTLAVIDDYAWSFTTYVPLVLTELRQIQSRVFAEDAIYYFSSNDNPEDNAEYESDICGTNQGDSIEVLIDPVNHAYSFRGLTVGRTYECNFRISAQYRGNSNLLRVGPFTVIPRPTFSSAGSATSNYGCKDPNASNYDQFSVSKPELCQYGIKPARLGQSSATETKTLGVPGLCQTEQTLTQNMRAPSKNGKYNSYTKGIVKEAAVLQTHLNRLGFASGAADGILGKKSDTAIKKMQTYLGTKPDGYVGPATRALINNSCGEKKSA